VTIRATVARTVIPYEVIQNTIAHEQDLELLRGTVAMLLGEVEAKRNRLVKLDPHVDPAVAQGTLDAARSQMGATHDVESMRALARNLFRGVEALDVQIARAEKP